MKEILKKTYRISAEANYILHAIMEERGLKTEAAAIELLIREYHSQRNGAEDFVKTFNEQNEEYMKRIRFMLQEAERNSRIILDVLNTMIHVYDPQDKGYFECMPTDDMPHPFIEQSKAKLKEKIAYQKQIKDNRRRKNGE